MADIISKQTEYEIAGTEISDEALEAAALTRNSGGYTQFGLCTVSVCTPGVTSQAPVGRETRDAAD